LLSWLDDLYRMSRQYRIIALIIGLIPYYLLFIKGWFALSIFKYSWLNGWWFSIKQSIVYLFFWQFDQVPDKAYVAFGYVLVSIFYLIWIWGSRYTFADFIENLIKKI